MMLKYLRCYTLIGHAILRFPDADEKRTISETIDSTIPPHSTESTPKKIYHPETKVQSLQNKFMDALIGRIWIGDVAIPSAKALKVFLTYLPYITMLMLGQVLQTFNIHDSM